jgi:hypothetical protein
MTCKQCGGIMVATRKSYCQDCAPSDRKHKSGVRYNTHWANLIRLYGVDRQMWNAMYFDQDGTCLICSENEAKVLDHNHETGRPRGLLCQPCNGFLGFVEAPGKLDAALKYLEESE